MAIRVVVNGDVRMDREPGDWTPIPRDIDIAKADKKEPWMLVIAATIAEAYAATLTGGAQSTTITVDTFTDGWKMSVEHQ